MRTSAFYKHQMSLLSTTHCKHLFFNLNSSMAEFPELGEACKVCNNLDFLPFICVYCREILCKEHREVLSHNCPKYEETNVNINEKPNSSAYEKCSFCAAKVKNKHELVQCEKCSLAHCLAHRHAEGHDCVKLKEETLQRNMLLKKPNLAPKVTMAPAGKKGVKNNDLAKKVAYMKLKQKAVGMSCIPATERLYFNVSVKELNDVEQPFFFSKEWSFGRCVDYLSTHLKIANRNNVKEAPKLVLCRIADGLQYDLSDKLMTALAQDNIADGDSLSFTHV